MDKRSIKLENAVFWNGEADDKVYMSDAQIVLDDHQYAIRLVIFRFQGGPAIDMSIYDADRLIAVYLELRGITTPPGLSESTKPNNCDFRVPAHIMRQTSFQQRKSERS